jgi:Uma2 family endonuclease
MSAPTPPPTLPGAPPPRRWSRDDYYRAHSLGLFGPEEKLELIRGEIREKMPQGTPHTIATERTERCLLRFEFAGLGTVRSQKPISLPDDSEPEPDVAFARGTLDDYTDNHPEPAEIHLVVEVSDTTLTYDRTDKAALYAEAGITEYWVLDVNARLLEIRRDPLNGEYRSLQTLRDTDTATPIFAPTESIPVGDLLPRQETVS